jgi:hypothetical protein
MVLSLPMSVSASDELTTADALKVLWYAAGLIELTPQEKGRLDMNGDKAITSSDAIAILRVTAGIDAHPELTPNAFLDGITISLDKSVYERSGTMNVTVTGLNRQMINEGAHLAIYSEGAVHRDFLTVRTPRTEACVLDFPAPAVSGTYEVRLFTGALTTSDTFFMRVSFTVAGGRDSAAS